MLLAYNNLTQRDDDQMVKVFLSAGHGGSDAGAIANGLYEKTVNLNTLLACKGELERHGVTVVCSRSKDENDPVSEEVTEANASGAEIAVSFHATEDKISSSALEAVLFFFAARSLLKLKNTRIAVKRPEIIME